MLLYCHFSSLHLTNPSPLNPTYSHFLFIKSYIATTKYTWLLYPTNGLRDQSLNFRQKDFFLKTIYIRRNIQLHTPGKCKKKIFFYKLSNYTIRTYHEMFHYCYKCLIFCCILFLDYRYYCSINIHLYMYFPLFYK